MLITEHDHAMFQMRAMHAGEIRIVERLGKIDADNFGTQNGIERTDVKVLRRGVGGYSRVHADRLHTNDHRKAQGTHQAKYALALNARLNG